MTKNYQSKVEIVSIHATSNYSISYGEAVAKLVSLGSLHPQSELF